MNSDSNIAFSHIVALKYLLAGDLDSVDLLRRLEDSCRAINWNDPQFLTFTESMRAGLPAPSKPATGTVEHLLALLHHMIEQNAGDEESLRLLLPEIEALGQRYGAAITLALALAKIVASMKTEMELLGADTSRYRVEIPPALKLPPATDVRE